MMTLQRTRRCREVTGPQPHSVAIYARPPNKNSPEKLILDLRREEEARRAAQHLSKLDDIQSLRNQWEELTNRKIQFSTIQRRIQSILAQNEFNIDERRERLKDMLAREEEEYLKELETQEETALERQSKMRERAKALREKREQERLEVVKEKYGQQFRDQCEELHQTLSKRQQDEVAADRIQQLHDKVQSDLVKKEEEAVWARLWEADRQAKAVREENVATDRFKRNAEVLKAIRLQMAALDEKKKEELELRKEEARLLEEQARLRKLEEKKEFEDKLRRREEAKVLFETSLQDKLKKRAREEQEQLAFDMKMLEQLLEESRNEALEMMEKKRAAREEDRRYREYLKAMQEEEKRREAELDKLVDAEVERNWQKRLQKWSMEREARKKLISQVVATRREQIAEKKRINALKQVQTQKEREELAKKIEENKLLDAEQLRKIRESNLMHQKDLIQQIDYNAMLRQQDEDETVRENILGEQAELEYQMKIKAALDDPSSAKLHPIRRRQMQLQHKK